MLFSRKIVLSLFLLAEPATLICMEKATNKASDLYSCFCDDPFILNNKIFLPKNTKEVKILPKNDQTCLYIMLDDKGHAQGGRIQGNILQQPAFTSVNKIISYSFVGIGFTSKDDICLIATGTSDGSIRVASWNLENDEVDNIACLDVDLGDFSIIDIDIHSEKKTISVLAKDTKGKQEWIPLTLSEEALQCLEPWWK